MFHLTLMSRSINVFYVNGSLLKHLAVATSSVAGA